MSVDHNSTAELDSTVFFDNRAGERGAGLDISRRAQVQHEQVHVLHF
jgi:hypothetical protein